MKIGLASDHSGYPLKKLVNRYVPENNMEFVDYGTHSEESCDYPDFAHALAEGMECGECEKGIAVCGSGEGISMTLNKHAHIRAALVWMPEIGRLARQHNDANVLVMPGRFIDFDMARAIMDEFLNTSFEGGRHERRVAKIPCSCQRK